MAQPRSLVMRLYVQSHLIDVARHVGGEGLLMSDAREQLQPLVEKYVQEKVEAATDGLVEIDTARDPPIVHLKEPGAVSLPKRS